MALKYFLEYYDTINVLHRAEISSPDFVGESTEVTGFINLVYSNAKHNLTTIRGSGLTLNLDASVDLTFEDLYSVKERTFEVKYFRNGIVTFDGWIDPEGLYQSFVRDSWLLTLSCADGISFLNNLSFIDPITFEIFDGKKSALEIVTICLQRTSVFQNINIGVDIYYDGLTETLDVFDNIYFKMGRYIKDDFTTIMNCREVLNDLLEIFAASLCSQNGEWFIYKANQLSANQTQTFFRYDSDGVPLAPATNTVDLLKLLGAQSNGFYPHHAGENQSMSIAASIGGYRIEYEYGLTQSLNENTNLSNDGVTLPGYVIDDAALINLPNDDYIEVFSTTGGGVFDEIFHNIPIAVPKGLEMLFTYRISISSILAGGKWAFFQITIVEDAPPNKTWWYNENREWQETAIGFTQPITGFSTINAITINSVPIDGTFSIEVNSPYTESVAADWYVMDIFTIKPIGVSGANLITSEYHTFERTDRPSTKIENVEKVFNGDNDSNLWEGTIYEADQTTQTTLWHRKGFAVEDADKKILRIAGEEKMRMNGEPSRMFKGTIFGYINYFSVVSIDNVPGLFMFLDYKYNTKDNTIDALFKEIQHDELTDLFYDEKQNTGGVTENPTIRGGTPI